jgi:bacteriocin-like protein
MKKQQKNAMGLKNLSTDEMRKIIGGKYIEIIIDGQKQLIWIPD